MANLAEQFGTQVSLTTTGASTADDVVTLAGTFTNNDSSTPDAPFAEFVFEPTFSVAPADGAVVLLVARLKSIDGASHAEVPTATYDERVLGSFRCKAVTSKQYLTESVRLPNQYASQVIDFYIHNKAGQTISVNWALKATPKTTG